MPLLRAGFRNAGFALTTDHGQLDGRMETAMGMMADAANYGRRSGRLTGEEWCQVPFSAPCGPSILGECTESTPAAYHGRTAKRPICPSSIHGSVPFLDSTWRRPGAAWRYRLNSKVKSQYSRSERCPSAHADGTDTARPLTQTILTR